MNDSNSTSKLAFLGGTIIVLLITMVIYLPGLPGDYIFDDYSSIFDNPAITKPYDGLAGLWQAMLSAPMGGLLRPLSMLSFIANYRLLEASPGGFKLVNILIHLCCAVTLLFLAREILRAYASKKRSNLDISTIAWLSLAATALWAVHPLNLTAVLYIVQRETSLGALFTAAAILAYMIGRRREREGQGGRILIWLLAPLCTLLGMFCKENAALAPMFMLVAEATLLGFEGRDSRPSIHTRWFYAVFLAAPMLLAIGLAILKPGYFFGGYPYRDFNMYERVLSEGRILLDYLHWTFIPNLQQLGLFHDDIVVSRGLLQPPSTLPSAFGIIGLLIAAIWLRKRLPLMSFGILWFFTGHLMESTILPLELVFEHRNYLPIFGLILGCAGTFFLWMQDTGNGRLGVLTLCALIGLLALTTAMRAWDWNSELNLARSESTHHPLSPRAMTELQWAYMRYVTATGNTSIIPNVLQVADKAKALDPDSINQDIGLAYMFAQLKDFPNAKLHLAMAAERAKHAGSTATTQLALQSLLKLDGAENHVLFADIETIFINAANNLRLPSPCYRADMWNTFSIFEEDIGKLPDALTAMHKAVTLCPTSALLHSNYARMFLRYGDTRDARIEMDAFKATMSFRNRAVLQQMESEYARQTQGRTPQ